MSHLTDDARRRGAKTHITVPGQSLEEIVAANPDRRRLLKNGLLGLSILPFAGVLSACDDDEASATPTPGPTPTPTPPPSMSFDVNFTAVPSNLNDTVTVPNGYVAEVLFKAGDPVESGAPGYSGSFQASSETERQAGGNHDGMEYYELTGVDPNEGGLLAINHELPDYNILMAGGYDAAAASAEQKALALSAVGVAVIEVAKGSDGTWSVKAGSKYNKRHTGNDTYRVGGPASGILPSTIKGTLNNCSSGRTPWGTYLTCEETTDNYLDPTQPEEGYGWVIEIDPYGELANPTKRTAMGRFNHENVAYMADANSRVAFYMGDDSTPGCIYKFVADRAFNESNRAANGDLLEYGTLFVARFNADGSGEWRALQQGANCLVVGAIDPGDVSQGPTTPATVDFPNQASVLLNAASAARVAGGTVMDRPEWITVAPDNSAIYCTLTNNSGREVTDAANPRVENRHGHIIKWSEEGNSPLATKFTWEIFVLAGDPDLQSGGSNLVGNIEGDTYSSPEDRKSTRLNSSQ